MNEEIRAKLHAFRMEDFNNLYLQVNNIYTQSKRDTYSLLELGL